MRRAREEKNNKRRGKKNCAGWDAGGMVFVRREREGVKEEARMTISHW